jgi:hypothetical protein
LCCIQFEVSIPHISARIEQKRLSASYRIDRCDVGAFEAIAMVTGEREVVSAGRAPVLFGRDVVRLVRCDDVILCDETVFTTIGCSLPH